MSIRRRPLRSAVAVVCLVGLGLGAMSTVGAAAEEAPATGLDGGCYLLRVTTVGTTAGDANYIVRSGSGYGTRGTVATAEPVVFEATRLGRYRLYDTSGGILYMSVLDTVLAGAYYGDRADWTVATTDLGHRISSTLTGQTMGSRSGSLVSSDGRFALEPATGCWTPGDIDPGGSGTPASGVNPDGTLNGIIDAHAHVTASAAFGGELRCGEPFAEGGVEVALASCASHSSIAPGSLLESLIGGTELSTGGGWPSFSSWPENNSVLHEQSYYRGIERAWKGGLRVLNALLVANRVICELYPSRTGSCDEMEQIRAQATLLNEMEDYVDAQNGGEGQGWFRIARTPGEVRQIAAAGKLAVIVGVENSELFGCREINDVPQCDESDIDAGLDELQAMGVSGLYPIHKFDNAFGGTRFDAGATGAVINIANLLSTGHWWTAERCEGATDNDQPLTSDTIADLLTTVTGLPPGTVAPVYPSGGICNTRGLTELGEYLVERSMERGMIIHIDHMGVRAARRTLEIAEEAGYPGIASVHSWSDRSIVGDIAELGGFIASYAYSASDAGNGEPGFLSEWRANHAAAGDTAWAGYGYGSDVNGLAVLAGPRLDAATDPLEYPFTAPSGVRFGRAVWGDRTWDLNTDGVAHYGLYADWYADLIQQAGADGPQLRQELMSSAEAYVRTWEAARTAAP